MLVLTSEATVWRRLTGLFRWQCSVGEEFFGDKHT
jgi:hypothetical protein